jgi:translocation and assembly module TamA
MSAYYHGMLRLRIVVLTGLLAWLAATGCGSTPKRVRKPGDEYLAKIELVGSNAIKAAQLVPGLALDRNLKAGRAIDEYQLSIDTQRVSGAFQKLGYFSVEVTPRVERKGDAQTLIFEIKEGPRATANVTIDGLPPEVSQAEARALVNVQDGAPFDYNAYDNAKTPLLALVENAGYAHAQLTANVLADRKTNTATMHYQFDTGPRVTFGKIEIIGVSGPLADAARARVTFEEGSGYSTKAIAETQEQIYALGLFSSVRVDADRSDLNAVIPVKISLAEALHWEARGGAGFGIDLLTYNARLRGSLSHTGWPTPLSTLGAEFRPALTVPRDTCDLLDLSDCAYEPRLRLVGTATQQDLLRKDVKGEVEGGYDYVTLEGYLQQGSRVLLGISTPLGTPRLTAHVGIQYANYNFSDINDAIDAATAAALELDHHERVGSVTETLALDLRDDPISPTRGAFVEVKLAQGHQFGGHAYDYAQLSPELRAYLPLGETVLAARARLGLILGGVPPTERYYAGGASSQRGFADRRLSPEAHNVDTLGNPISVVVGGAGIIETGVELRRHFEPWGIKAGGVVFLDGGDVTLTPGELDPGHLHWAIGAGIRFFYLPIGPIRLEVAQRLDRTGSGEPSAGDKRNYIISVGEAF